MPHVLARDPDLVQEALSSAAAGNTFVSQNQTPIEYRRAKNSAPTSPRKVSRWSAFRQTMFVSYGASAASSEVESMPLSARESTVGDRRERHAGVLQAFAELARDLAQPSSPSKNPAMLTPGLGTSATAGSRSPARSRALERPLEQRPHDTAPLAAERPAGGVALAGVEDLEGDGLVDRRVVLGFGKSTLQMATSALTAPSFRRLPGIHAVAAYSPAAWARATARRCPSR